MIGTMLLAVGQEVSKLSGSGIALMIGCIGFVLVLCAFCFWRLSRSSNTTE